jgi:hypothetical protein
MMARRAMRVAIETDTRGFVMGMNQANRSIQSIRDNVGGSASALRNMGRSLDALTGKNLGLDAITGQLGAVTTMTKGLHQGFMALRSVSFGSIVAGLTGVTASTTGATAATNGLRLATIAWQATATLGVSLVIAGIISIVSNLQKQKTAMEELAKKEEEERKKRQESLKNTAKENQAFVDSQKNDEEKYIETVSQARKAIEDRARAEADMAEKRKRIAGGIQSERQMIISSLKLETEALKNQREEVKKTQRAKGEGISVNLGLNQPVNRITKEIFNTRIQANKELALLEKEFSRLSVEVDMGLAGPSAEEMQRSLDRLQEKRLDTLDEETKKRNMQIEKEKAERLKAEQEIAEKRKASYESVFEKYNKLTMTREQIITYETLKRQKEYANAVLDATMEGIKISAAAQEATHAAIKKDVKEEFEKKEPKEKVDTKSREKVEAVMQGTMADYQARMSVRDKGVALQEEQNELMRNQNRILNDTNMKTTQLLNQFLLA